MSSLTWFILGTSRFLKIASLTKIYMGRFCATAEGEQSTNVLALFLWLPCLLYETNFHLCSYCKYFVFQIIESCLWWHSNHRHYEIIKWALYLFYTQSSVKYGMNTNKRSQQGKTIPRYSIPSTMVKNLGFKIRYVHLKTYWWFDFGLVTTHPRKPNVKMGSEWLSLKN